MQNFLRILTCVEQYISFASGTYKFNSFHTCAPTGPPTGKLDLACLGTYENGRMTGGEANTELTDGGSNLLQFRSAHDILLFFPLTLPITKVFDRLLGDRFGGATSALQCNGNGGAKQ